MFPFGSFEKEKIERPVKISPVGTGLPWAADKSRRLCVTVAGMIFLFL